MEIDWANKTRRKAVADDETGMEPGALLFVEKTGRSGTIGGMAWNDL